MTPSGKVQKFVLRDNIQAGLLVAVPVTEAATAR